MGTKRKALVVGVDAYDKLGRLYGCANDAEAVAARLGRHKTKTAGINFHVKTLLCRQPPDLLTEAVLLDHIRDLFNGDGEIALFYFAGHGHVDAAGGHIFASDASGPNNGTPLTSVLAYANNSRAQNRIIILDSCHSGAAGDHATQPGMAELREGTTILTASTAEQYAKEDDGSGLFTGLLIDALDGSAADLTGAITLGSIYAHIDQSLGPWEQRPVFKTHVKSFVSLRDVDPVLTEQELRMLTEFFPSPVNSLSLDPTFEPEREKDIPPNLPEPDDENVKKFAILQKYNRVNLVVPHGAPHMWHAAMFYKACKLTPLGRHYRRLVEEGLF